MKFSPALVFFIVLLAGCSSAPSSCPESCDDSNYCTLDYCSNETGLKCAHEMQYINPIFSDDMAGEIEKWNDIYKTNAWKISEGVLSANYTYSPGSMPAYLFADINNFKGNYAITGKFNLEKGVLVIASRLTNNEGYIVLLQNSALLLKNNSTQEGVPPSILARSMNPIPKNEWLNFKLISIDEKLFFYIENVKLLEASDNLFKAGNFGFAILSDMNFNSSDSSIDANKGLVQIDDVRIYEINSSNYLCIE